MSFVKRFVHNWKSGVTVALVSIPLSIALAIASGATPTQGIITAFWAGIIGALLGGSQYNIIGPTGALSGVLVAFSVTYGYEMLPIIAIISGIIIFVFYIFHFEKYIIFIPKSVVHGFTLGVACIIALGQLNNMLGISPLEKGDSLVENVYITLVHISEMHISIFALFIIGVLLIFLWDRKVRKFPGSILIAFMGIITSMILHVAHTSFQLDTIASRYSSITASLFQNIFQEFQWDIFLNREVWIISLATAVIAILETLLSGQIARNMTNVDFDRSREVFGLSFANVISGFMGGIPATAALARTALNIKSGANHRTSGVISALTLGGITLFLFSFFTFLPMVVIASILFVVAVRMVEAKHFMHLVENEKVSFFLSLFVAIVTVVEDPIIGLMVGTFIALLIFVNKVSYGQTEILLWKNGRLKESFLKTEISHKDSLNSDLVVYKISGTLTYINMPAHLEAVQKIRDNAYVIVSLRHAFYADLDGIDYLKELIEVLEQNNDRVYLSGINAEIYKFFSKEPCYFRKNKKGEIFNRTSEAIHSIYGK